MFESSVFFPCSVGVDPSLVGGVDVDAAVVFAVDDGCAGAAVVALSAAVIVELWRDDSLGLSLLGGVDDLVLLGRLGLHIVDSIHDRARWWMIESESGEVLNRPYVFKPMLLC